jgi:hypothetical protein
MKKPICKCGQNKEVCLECILDWVERADELLLDIFNLPMVDMPSTRKIISTLNREVKECN